MNSTDAGPGVNYSTRSIRFAMMNPGTTLQEWQARCLTHLLALDKVEVVLSIIVDESDHPQPSSGNMEVSRLNRICFETYSNVFARPYSTRVREISKVLVGVPSMHCKVAQSIPPLCFSNQDIQTIRTYDLDFILWFGSSPIRGELLNVTRHGIWSFRNGDEGGLTAGLPCFWEMHRDDDSIQVTLVRLTGQANSNIVLKKGFLGINDYSYARNVDEVLFETACWPTRVCIDILKGNHEYLKASPSHSVPSVSRVPDIFELLLFVVKMLKNRVVRICNIPFFHDQWNIGIAYEPIYAFLKSKPKIHYLPAPKNGTFLADPFGIVRDKKLTILCEEFTYSSFKGVVSSIELVDEFPHLEPVPALGRPVHVSYPYLIEYDGEIYCIPETAAAREVALYKATGFPHEWVKIATLINGVAAIDPTVFQYDGRWWLMCTDKEQNAFLNLFAWYAEDLLGPWKPHAANPIKTDIHSARSAGTPFTYEGFLYRPAQDCSRTYGGRIVLNRVVCLTPRDFEEEQVGIIEPCPDGPYRHGIHTISAVGDFTLVDGKRVVFVASAFHRKLIRALSKIFRFDGRSRQVSLIK